MKGSAYGSRLIMNDITTAVHKFLLSPAATKPMLRTGLCAAGNYLHLEPANNRRFFKSALIKSQSIHPISFEPYLLKMKKNYSYTTDSYASSRQGSEFSGSKAQKFIGIVSLNFHLPNARTHQNGCDSVK